ncbi:hypothetical protein [Candidatus Lariskella endosymbiont of Epinotia ramella]|uniref:hypothetical protein n=1 Tax=Candidatus Lariskella endosymbiont of Epinotia ramella TaxID=3066224 RepID=UPI0030D2729B
MQEVYFFKKDAVEKLKIEIALFRADYSLCDITGKGDYIPLNYAPKALAKSTLDQCRAIGGKQISAKTTIEMICKIFNSEHTLGAYISDAFKMTCANYHSFIHFDTMGEIIGLKMSHHDILKQYAIEHYEF